MKVIHGFWRPEIKKQFVQSGWFYIWVESDEVESKKNKSKHPQHLREQDCLDFLQSRFAYDVSQNAPKPQYHKLYLPTEKNSPIVSPELLATEMSEQVSLDIWQVYSCPLINPIKEIGDIYFLSNYQAEDILIGRDFLFWYYF